MKTTPTTTAKGAYRSEGSHLFLKRGNSFVHVYQNPRCTRIASLIAAYERQCAECGDIEFVSN